MSKIDNILTTLGTNNSSQIATAVLAGFKMIFLPLATATDKTASQEQKTYTIIRDIIMEALALVTYIGVTGQIQKHATAPICKAYYKDKAKKLEKTGLLTPEELEFLRNIDSKKIKMAGEDFLNRLSPNRKKFPEEVQQYIEKLNEIVEKVEDFVSELNVSKPNVVTKETGKATQKGVEVLKPLKVFQNTRIALSQLSVWILAVAIIPPLCNAVIAPIMKKFGPKTNNTVPVKTAKEQPLVLESVKQSKNNALKKKAIATNFQANYSTGMRV
jgi:predicted house-cleaning noncanonical NTP pyrophosphatase (MazG superfamily)